LHIGVAVINVAMGIPPIKPTSVHQNGYPKMKIMIPKYNGAATITISGIPLGYLLSRKFFFPFLF
jgi:hypothetical protein